MKRFAEMLFLLLLVSGPTACRRSPVAALHELRIAVHFTAGTVAPAEVDSVLVRMLAPGGQVLAQAPLQASGSTFSGALPSLPDGACRVLVAVYQHKDDRGGIRCFERDTALQLSDNMQLQFQGPSGRRSDAWKGYVLLQAARASVRMPLNFADPEFEVQLPTPADWNSFVVDKVAVYEEAGSATMVASKQWNCVSGPCYLQGHAIRNATEFRAFAQTVGSRRWNKGSFMVLVGNAATGDEVLFLYAFTSEP